MRTLLAVFESSGWRTRERAEVRTRGKECVESAGGDDAAVVEGAGDADALALAAGEAECGRRFGRTGALGGRHAGSDRRKTALDRASCNF
jgi:hypothetical protein